jgi:hypothetical protein
MRAEEAMKLLEVGRVGQKTDVRKTLSIWGWNVVSYLGLLSDRGTAPPIEHVLFAEHITGDFEHPDCVLESDGSCVVYGPVQIMVEA